MINSKIKNLFLSFSPREKIFILAAMICGVLISFDYAIIRPVSNSLFIEHYGSNFFPYAWLCSIPLNLLIVSLYNRFLPRLGCFKIFIITAVTITLINALSAFFISSSRLFPFVYYVWKDIYVMLMFQLLWSVIHSTIDLSRAKYLYGLLFGIGASGGLAGSFLTGQWAVRLGSETLLLSTIVTYFFLGLCYYVLIKNSANIDQKLSKEVKKESSLQDSFALIKSSKLLISIMLMVVFMQVTATLTDFQFNTFLERLYPQKDVRTAYFGRLLGYGNILTMSFQLLGVYVLIRFMGKFKTHLLVPLVLCVNGIGFILFPVYGVISYAFVTIKCFDFSLFNVIKEMLYIPLKIEEKFRAKALIDVFVYRGAKVFASIFVISLQTLWATSLIPIISWINISIFLLWCYVVISIKKHYFDTEPLTLTS
jgi:AAA family ATP:ADP antiporter